MLSIGFMYMCVNHTTSISAPIAYWTSAPGYGPANRSPPLRRIRNVVLRGHEDGVEEYLAQLRCISAGFDEDE